MNDKETDLMKRAARNERIEAHEIISAVFPECLISKDENGTIIIDLSRSL